MTSAVVTGVSFPCVDLGGARGTSPPCCEGVRGLLDSQADIEVVAARGYDSLLAAVEAEHPDVVVTDIRMPPGNADEGIEAAARSRHLSRTSGWSGSSQYANPTYALALLGIRANGAGTC